MATPNSMPRKASAVRKTVARWAVPDSSGTDVVRVPVLRVLRSPNRSVGDALRDAGWR